MRLIKFLKLAKKRQVGYFQEDYKNYIKFQNFQAKEILRELKKRKVLLSGKNVLELAVGTGGYSPVFMKKSKSYIMNDISYPAILKFNKNIPFKKFDATKKYPFKDNTFDFIFCCSLIEHVKNPEKMLNEVKRVLKPSGYLYLSFPPFYSPVGGHYFKPFHLFGQRVSVMVVRMLKKGRKPSYENGFGDFGLYIRTIKNVKKLLIKEGFYVVDYWARYPSWAFIAKIPFFNEFFTWHVCFLCKNKK